MLQKIFFREGFQIRTRPVSPPPQFVPDKRALLSFGWLRRSLFKVQTIEMRATAQGEKRHPFKLCPLWLQCLKIFSSLGMSIRGGTLQKNHWQMLGSLRCCHPVTFRYD